MNINLIVPAHNESANLETCIRSLSTLYYDTQITISADGSNDNTEQLAHKIAKQYLNIYVTTSPDRLGKGKAIKNALLNGAANGYIDADLAVHPYNLKPMYDLLQDRGGLVIAKRLPTNRSKKRSLTSKTYNTIVRLLFRTGVTDHQAGCKLLSKEATQIARQVKADGFFFDTELIIRCKKAGLPITEYPTVWTEHKQKSTVSLGKDSLKMFASLLVLKVKS